MTKFKALDNVLSVCGQVDEDDLVMAAGLGFKTLINNRPDGEVVGQPTSQEIAAWAKQQGLTYHYLPIQPNDLPMDSVVDFGELYQGEGAPILAFCTSGLRSSVLWSFMMAIMSDGKIDEIIAQSQAHGFDLSTLRDPMLSVREAMLAHGEEG